MEFAELLSSGPEAGEGLVCSRWRALKGTLCIPERMEPSTHCTAVALRSLHLPSAQGHLLSVCPLCDRQGRPVWSCRPFTAKGAYPRELRKQPRFALQTTHPGTELGPPGERAPSRHFHKDAVFNCVSKRLVCPEGNIFSTLHKAAVWCGGPGSETVLAAGDLV